MSLVNELLQSVRFLKYMGWGELYASIMRLRTIMSDLCGHAVLESHWTSKVKTARETELAWRVKENVLASVIAYVISAQDVLL